MYLCKLCNEKLQPPAVVSKYSNNYRCWCCKIYLLQTNSMYTYDGSGYFEFLFYGNLYFLYKSVPQTIVLANFGGTKLKEFSLKELTPEIAKQYLEELKIYNVFS